MENRSEIKSCQNCKKDFTIESDDFSFYEKIKVPPPTFCPECRAIRRMASSNERFLYKRKCDLTSKDIFSMYTSEAVFPVYHPEAWYGDDWDPYQYGVDYDFSKPFFEQFLALRNKVPKMALVRQGMSVNSEYTHRAHDMKNSYMVFRMSNSEDSMYSYVGKNIKSCVDCLSIWDSEFCYECIDCNNSYKLKFSQESHSCRDSSFLYACKNCSDCVGCVNLVNQSYTILNQKYSKEEYSQILENLKLDTRSGIEKFQKEFEEFRKKFPHRSTHSLKSDKFSGNWIVNSHNVKNSFGSLNVKDGKYLTWVFDAQDCMDYFQWGNNSELIYESENCGINCSRILFSTQCWISTHDLTYCDSCPGASNSFGCIGLKKGEYSILNKRYTKEEYEELLPKIINHMNEMPYIDSHGLVYKYGEHFPNELSTFAYNETAAIDFYPLTKEEAINLGFKWKDKEKNNYNTTLQSKDLADSISEVDDSILNEIIACADEDKEYSPGAFRITANELAFYQRMNLPLPKYSFNARHVRRLNKRPPLKLIERVCGKCNILVQTVYTKDFAPIVYCEKCYQAEVY